MTATDGPTALLQALTQELKQHGIEIRAIGISASGFRVSAVAEAEPFQQWYSTAELHDIQRRQRAEADRPPPIAGDRATSERGPIYSRLALGAFALTSILILMAQTIASQLPETEFIVTEPTEVYSETGAFEWMAQPGERFNVVFREDNWYVAVSEFGSSSSAVWIAKDKRVDGLSPVFAHFLQRGGALSGSLFDRFAPERP